MASRQSQKRLTKEYKSIQANPPPYIIAKPNDENILEWHYVITGPANTPYEDGQYHGILRFPTEYPFKPPSIYMNTPNGRFQQNTRLCLSMSDFHPDTWNPAWSVATILTGLLSFMTGDETTTGSITTTDNVKRKLAKDSKKWNMSENPRFKKHFPDLAKQNEEDIQKMKIEEQEEKLHQIKVGGAVDPDKPIDLTKLDMLDPEDRARILVEQEKLGMVAQTNGFSGITLIGVAVAAFIAAYFTILRRG
ncbi:ubiquitin-conjugating enzyme E2 6 [Spathaspora passalidarum NRRL Y-27907]|uniref:Ubiquitin-conjugating enzyme E2 6 n=1 Tax=Spathaspora passalidarum (strain NRRL Y-27907 / 11-Y1) TaxID=619300 RepID=G3AR29_SPAPN|nr:ubiquitin-conjugating enzyme E2 6 [Spathaspora passalidarum NRRL Y-27907]EGW31690.1 ubiquitin-conjugating enzyme E2 6 [Spathaspora passalidarum NRRL Y-27907]